VLNEVDRGRFLQLISFVERPSGLVTTGYSGTNNLPESVRHAIQSHMSNAAQRAAETADFKEGMSVVVLCGLGRRFALPVPQIPYSHLAIEVIASFDFDSLCWIPEFDALSLMRLIAARERMGSEDVAILNASGLLNLVAWMRQLKGHLVPTRASPRNSHVKVARKSLRLKRTHCVLCGMRFSLRLIPGESWM